MKLSFSRWLTVSLLVAACDPQAANWGLQAIDTMQTPPDPNLTCGVVIPPDTLASQRAGCAFGPGATVEETLGIDAATIAQIPIRHVIVMMKENRSFDELLSQLSNQNPAVEAEPSTYTNPDVTGAQVSPFHATNTCYPWDPGHQSDSVTEMLDGLKMDGFVKNAAKTTGTDGHFVMAYYEPTDLPFYFFLANTFALSQSHFAPMASGTYANRDFMMLGTNAGVVDTGIVYPAPSTPSIMRLLMNAGYTWGVYTDGSPFSGALDWSQGDPGVHTLPELYTALQNGTLPNVAFVDGKDNIEDDHPDADLQAGEVWSRGIYEAVIASPQWKYTAMIWTYDEAGGFADHVPPPMACKASPDSPWTQMGPRVPLVAISPWAKRGYVSSVVHDHTAITRFIATLFNLPALTSRDANNDALFDLFDFSCPEILNVLPAPMPGTGGCVNPAPPGTN